MKRRISSAQTFFYKVVCLVVWAGSGLYVLIDMPAALDDFETNKFLLVFFVIWLIGLGLLLWTNLPLKKVEIEDDVLHVSNYFKTIDVRLSNIALVKKIISGGSLPRYRVKLELNIDTEFGNNIYFVPTLKFDIPQFLEVVERSKRL